MLLAAVMAMVLAAAAPAFAQATAVGGSVQYVDCDQIQAAATGQYNANNTQNQAGIGGWWRAPEHGWRIAAGARRWCPASGRWSSGPQDRSVVTNRAAH
jgi:hypothetical protein